MDMKMESSQFGSWIRTDIFHIFSLGWKLGFYIFVGLMFAIFVLRHHHHHDQPPTPFRNIYNAILWFFTIVDIFFLLSRQIFFVYARVEIFFFCCFQQEVQIKRLLTKFMRFVELFFFFWIRINFCFLYARDGINKNEMLFLFPKKDHNYPYI